jgi:uncharacterized membrane protein SpoIIM required for sporulation
VTPQAISARWIEKRQPHWTRLDALVKACDARGVSALPHGELQELALLYRQAAADLSTARDDPASRQLARQLNQLLTRAHNLLYAGRRGDTRQPLAFLTRTFPRTFRATSGYTLAAVLMFAAGAAVGLIMAIADPGFERFLLGGPMMDTIERREMWTHGILAVKPLAATQITTNNLSVSFIATASGMLAGLGTLYIIVFNGLLIGVVGGACFRAGMSVPLWSFVAPHGALELPAIFIAGGAGLILGHAILVPGDLSRRDAIAEAGALAVRLFLGVVPMLLIAGAIEGFISPTPIPPAVKFVIGASIFALLAVYLAMAGRDLSESRGRSDSMIRAIR